MNSAVNAAGGNGAATRRGARVGAVAFALVLGLGLSSCAATGAWDGDATQSSNSTPNSDATQGGAVTPSGSLPQAAPRTWTEPAAPSTWLEPQEPGAGEADGTGEPDDTSEPGRTDESGAAQRPGTSASPGPAPGAVTVAQALEQIPTKGRAPKTGYARDEFGRGWKDPDRNGCDSRNDILGRDLSGKTYKPRTRECVVLTGTLADPYTGGSISFRRGSSTSMAVQIDHVVALSDAWQKGAQKLDADTRLRLANDPLNLLAVDGPTNSRKSDGDAATWLPPRKAYRCAYVARQSAVKLKYGLWMTQAEKAAISRVVASCPAQAIPAA